MWAKFFGCSVNSVCLQQNGSPFPLKQTQEQNWEAFKVNEQICSGIYEIVTRVIDVAVTV